MNDTIVRNEDFSIRCQKVLGVARQLYQGGPDWVTFFREVLGVEGAARQVFESQAEFVSFEKSNEYAEVQQMVTSLRNRKGGDPSNNEATRVITVRLPESLHEALKAEASDHNTSMNKLCIAKLLQVLAENAKAAPSTTIKRSTAPAPVAAMPRPMTQPAPGTNAGTNAGASTGGFRSTWSPTPQAGSKPNGGY